MPQSKVVTKTPEGLDEVNINAKKSIECPYFIPEIKGAEGVQALLRAKSVLEESNPIMVPGLRWRDIRSKPQFKELEEEIKNLIAEHQFYYYEPIELYRYSRPQALTTYAFRGDRSKKQEFNSLIREHRPEDAIETLPKFFQPFAEKQIKSIFKSTDGVKVPTKYRDKRTGKIYEAWRDDRADKGFGFEPYFDEIIEDAARLPNATVMPPVPPVLKTSGTDVLHRTMGYNEHTANTCEEVREDSSKGNVTPFLHFYIDQGIFGPGTDNDEKVKKFIQIGVRDLEIRGVSLTISNYDKIWENGNSKSLEDFINEVSNFARERHLPLVLPRSKWYGAHLTDYGAHAFSTLMNGNQEYPRRGGGIERKYMYGKVPVYGAARELTADKLHKYLQKNGSLPDIPGLKNEPDTYNENESSYPDIFGASKQFRIKFGKPRRLTHVKEAEEFRDSLKRGNPSPARRYLERSEHEHLA